MRTLYFIQYTPMTFHTLQNTGIATLTASFNEAFSDYVVPLRLTEMQLADKIKSDSLKLELSVGAFDNDRLVGLIIHGYDMIEGKRVVYNGGTGVVPSYRGRELTARLYQYALPLLKEQNIDKIVLEVITINSVAQKVYESIGFRISRSLNCYKGAIRPVEVTNNFVIKPLADYNWGLLQTFWDCKPSWQNGITALEQLHMDNVSIGIYDDESLIGYLIFNPKTNRVQQFAVDKRFRNKGAAKQLFSFIAADYSQDISVINVDDAATATNAFLQHIGLEIHIVQYEMEMDLKR
jgi:ribosomal protein S18 acetylase RimI-like enzyme